MKDANGKYYLSGGKPVPAPKNAIVIPKMYNFGRVTRIEFIMPDLSASKANADFANYFNNIRNSTNILNETCIINCAGRRRRNGYRFDHWILF